MSDVSLPPDAPDMSGTQYVIERLLGEGGFGRAYLVFNRGLRRRCVMKVLTDTTNAGFVARFYREAQVMANLDHVAIPRVYEVNTTKLGEPYFVMEFIDGQPLGEYMVSRGGQLPLAEACTIIAGAAEGLAAAHEVGVVHRDVKLPNLLVNTKGQVKVIDFGIARKAVQDGDRTPGIMTSIGQLLGTPRYMSPEQALAKALGPPSDMYSLGVVLCILLTGRSPFDGTAHEMMCGHVREAPPTLATLSGENFSADIEALVANLLSKNPLDRYQTGYQLAEALRRIAAAHAAPSAVAASGPQPGISPEAVSLAVPPAAAPVVVGRDAPTAAPAPTPTPAPALPALEALRVDASTAIGPRGGAFKSTQLALRPATAALLSEPSMTLAATGFAPSRADGEAIVVPPSWNAAGQFAPVSAEMTARPAVAIAPARTETTPSSVQTFVDAGKGPRRRGLIPITIAVVAVCAAGLAVVLVVDPFGIRARTPAPEEPGRSSARNAARPEPTTETPRAAEATVAPATSVAPSTSAVTSAPIASTPSSLTKPDPSIAKVPVAPPSGVPKSVPKKAAGVTDEMY